MSGSEIRIWWNPAFIWVGTEGEPPQSRLLGDNQKAWITASGSDSAAHGLGDIGMIAATLRLIHTEGVYDAATTPRAYELIGRMLERTVGGDLALLLEGREGRKRAVSQLRERFTAMAEYLEDEAMEKPPTRTGQLTLNTARRAKGSALSSLLKLHGFRQVSRELLTLQTFRQWTEEHGVFPTQSSLREKLVEEDASMKMVDKTFRELLQRCHLSKLQKKGVPRLDPDAILTGGMMLDEEDGPRRLLAIQERLMAMGEGELVYWARRRQQWRLLPTAIPLLSGWRPASQTG